jgi:hypothetical protein
LIKKGEEQNKRIGEKGEQNRIADITSRRAGTDELERQTHRDRLHDHYST